MKKTNYDNASCGVNIALDYGYDEFMAQINFEENFIAPEKNSLKNVYVYGYDSLESLKQVAIPVVDTKKIKDELEKDACDSLILTLKNEGYYGWSRGYHVEDYTDGVEGQLADVVESLEWLIERYYTDILASYLNESSIFYYTDNDPDIDCILEYVKFELKESVSFYISKGYNQGDSIAVVMRDYEGASDCVDSLLWDCPYYVNVEIDDESVEFWDVVDSEYNYDKVDFIKNFKEAWKEENEATRAIVLAFLDENLPEYLD